MRPTQDTYPVFEANQVLTNKHLNQAFDYSDEQARLTRANLIGIGIVCGLDFRLETTTAATTLHLTKGCGITSEGYLIVEPEDVALVAYRAGFAVPPAPGYPPLLDPDSHVQYPLWELFPAGEPNVQALGSPANFLDDKALLLLLELKEESLRDCSLNNCDDKGAAVTATLRRLLVRVADATKILAAAQGQPEADPEATLLARLNLPDLRLPRYDVPNTSPTSSADVLAGFHAVFQANKLVHQMAAALTAAYQAFRPVLEPPLAADPFAGFTAQFGFLDSAPATTAQVRFLPYYYDFFGDLLQAYDELRWKGAELLCACCPAEGLFPRHLLAGALRPALAAGSTGADRQRFLPAGSGCAEATREVGQLFQRLVALISSFTAAPPLPVAHPAATDAQIRLVPSQLADVPLSAKAIPYYYLQTDTPPLYQLWSPLRSRRNRAFHNLGYRADEYVPPAPAFVTDPLRYDLEPYNFLRVEGHLGKPYQSVLRTLLDLRARHRLPIDVIALRTGAFDETQAADPAQATARFEDLETLYDTLREEILGELAEGARFLYGTGLGKVDVPGPGRVALALLKKYAPGLLYQANTVGAWFEQNLTRLLALPYIDIDQAKINDNSIWTVYGPLFQQDTTLTRSFYPHVVAVHYFAKLAEVLPESLSALNFADLANKYEDLLALVRYFRSEAANFPTELAAFRPQEELIDHFDQVLFGCKLEPLRAVRTEYQRRLRELKQQQFLGAFLRSHPGIQHKAGVPLGGTFILVYHDDPAPTLSPTVFKTLTASILAAQPTFNLTEIPALNPAVLAATLHRIGANEALAADPDIRLLLGSLTGTVPDLRARRPDPSAAADKIIKQTVAELVDGTVIADFYLPYLCRAAGGVQFVLPKPPPTFAVAVGCTNANQQAEATLTPAGGLPPYSYQADGGDFRPLTGVLLLSTGKHTLVVRDAEATASAPQTVEVLPPLTLAAGEFKCQGTATYQAEILIAGGQPPYSYGGKELTGNSFLSDAAASGKPLRIAVTDRNKCAAQLEVTHTCCTLPCDGQSRRVAYRLWLQPPTEGARYEMYRPESEVKFRFNGKDIKMPDMSDFPQLTAEQLNTNFSDALGGVIKKLNDVLNRALIKELGPEGNNRLVMSYQPSPADPFSVLLLEYFVCEKFTIEFDYVFAKPSPTFSLTIRYTNESAATAPPFDGTILTNRRSNNKEIRVPAFAGSERNQCTGSEYHQLCEGPVPKPVVSIAPAGNNNFTLAGKVNSTPTPENEITAWVWDVLTAQATEPFYEGQKVPVQLQKLSGNVRLTAITKNGCFGATDQKLTP